MILSAGSPLENPAGNVYIIAIPDVRCASILHGEITKNTFQKIYAAVKKIPAGRVATYGQIAALAGNPRWARTVGRALHLNPDPTHIPCFRVVNKNGEASKSFAFGGKNTQIRLLKNEGVEFRNGRVVMSEYLWKLQA